MQVGSSGQTNLYHLTQSIEEIVSMGSVKLREITGLCMNSQHIKQTMDHLTQSIQEIVSSGFIKLREIMGLCMNSQHVNTRSFREFGHQNKTSV